MDTEWNIDVKVPALEKNILKFRALEMVVVLFQAESLKRYVVESIRATDRTFPREDASERLPERATQLIKKAFAVLVDEGVLTREESSEVQGLLDFRNLIAHRVDELVRDVAIPGNPTDLGGRPESRYEYDVLDRLERYRRKIEEGLRPTFVQSLSLDRVNFEAAEAAYREEMSKLARRIDRQLAARALASG